MALRVARKRTTGTARRVHIDRLGIIQFGFGVVVCVLSARLFWVQVISHQKYTAMAADQHDVSHVLEPERGQIFAHDQFADNKLALVAGSRTLYEVYLNPELTKENASQIADILTQTLQVDHDTMLARASKENSLYAAVKHEVTQPEIDLLKTRLDQAQLKGVYWDTEDARWYPEAQIMSALTGFVGYVGDTKKGQYGLEGYYQNELAGTAGSFSAQLDQGGRYIATGQKDVTSAQNGDMLVLTIDRNIQYKACSELQEAFEKFSAKRGSLIIENPKTGAIMAMCSVPAYDANDYSHVDDISVFQNNAISYEYEPGSVMKAIAISASVNEGKITPYTTYDDVGEIHVQGFPIYNYTKRAYGTVDMITVLKESLNLGSVYAVQQIGNEKWDNYMHAFGFGKETGITLANEGGGNISQVDKKQDVYTDTSSFGQGVTVTSLQMVEAYAAIANGGVMMKPYIVEQDVDANGLQRITDPQEAGRPITPETARTVAAMLVTVVDEGHSKHAAVSGYSIAGKTGTAQVVNPDGTYDANRHRDSFIGFAPVSDPQYVILVNLDEPQGVPTAESSVVPVAGDLNKFLLNYLKIPPDRVGQ